jgi:alkylhydroperoxidase family enzyme
MHIFVEDALMPRVPFVPADLAEPKEVVDAVRARRGGTLLELDRLLLHSPMFTQGWNAHLNAVRTQLSVHPILLELAICTVAVLNGAEYEFVIHAPIFAEAGGTPEQVAAIRDVEAALRNEQVFSAAQRATIRLALEMTRNVKVGDATFDTLAKALGNTRQVVELVGTIASYNMVSRFLVALDLHPD